MRLATTSRAADAPLSAPLVAVRVRPGDRPAWVDCSREHEEFPAWRARAGARRVPLDAWAATALELMLVIEDLRAIGVADPVPALNRAIGNAPRRLAPTPQLRAWVDAVGGGRWHAAELPDDELPELVLPQRLVHQLRHGARIGPLLDPELDELALSGERTAAAEGRTLEAWALRLAASGALT